MGGEPVTDLFVAMVKAFTPQYEKDALHRYGLLRLAERKKDKERATAGFKESELRLFLYYALKKGIDERIHKIASEILYQNRDTFFQHPSSLKDDEVSLMSPFPAPGRAEQPSPFSPIFVSTDRSEVSSTVPVELVTPEQRELPLPTPAGPISLELSKRVPIILFSMAHSGSEIHGHSIRERKKEVAGQI